jgi:hypothetical protein
MVGSIEAVLAALNTAHVRYLVVGGVAVVLHGHLRTTADLDLVIQLKRDNVLNSVRVLAELGYRPRAPVRAEQLADASVRESWLRGKGLTVLGMWSDQHPGLEIDLFVEEPFDFDRAYARAVTVALERTEATVVSLPDLVAMKRAAGRPVDLDDIERLEALDEEHDPE